MADSPDADESVDSLSNKTLNLTARNQQYLAEIAQCGATFEMSAARLNHFMNFLVTSGTISATQRWEEEYLWQVSLRAELVEMRDNLRQSSVSTSGASASSSSLPGPPLPPPEKD